MNVTSLASKERKKGLGHILGGYSTWFAAGLTGIVSLEFGVF
jgi:hypothetical protein